MFKKPQTKKSEDVKKSASKVLDPKKDTATRAKHLRLFLDNSETYEILQFFETYYSHVFFIVYDAFIAAELNLRQKGAHKAQREELEGVLYLLEKVLIYLPEHLGRKWQYHSVGRLMSKLLHPGNSWKLIKREAVRLFLIWYQILGDASGEALHAMFATLVPGFPSPYQGLGLTALAALTPDSQDGPVSAAEICPLIPPQTGERWRSPDTDLTRIFLDVLLELMVSQVPLIEWRDKPDKQRKCFNFLFEKFKTFYMPHIFPDFNWTMSLYRPSLELPEVRKFRPAFVDTGDGTKKMDPMLACRVVVVKWVAQYTHVPRGGIAAAAHSMSSDGLDTSGLSGEVEKPQPVSLMFEASESTRNTAEGNLVREILYAHKDNVNFVHEVYRQAFLLSFSHSPAIKKVISVYKDWIQMNVPELPPFMLEPLSVDREREDFMNALSGRDDVDGRMRGGAAAEAHVRAGLQNVLQIFVTNAANVFLLEVSPEYPILLEEQVEMCKRVLNIYRYMVMNVKMEARTWEQLLFILLQITQLTLTETPPRRREDCLGGGLAQAIFQTLIVTWIKANLYVVVSTELWDQFLEVLSSLTLWEELVREWAKTMETLTRVLARQVYNLDLNDLPLDKLGERDFKKQRRGGGRQAALMDPKLPSRTSVPPRADPGANGMVASTVEEGSGTSSIVGPSLHPPMRRASPFTRKRTDSDSGSLQMRSPAKKTIVSRSMSEGNIYKFRGQQEEFSYFRRRRSKSVDSWIGRGGHSETSDASRSCSPAPSSGIECGSMKDSPMQLDPDTMSEASDVTAVAGTNEPRSVMSGGAVKGWLPDVAVVLWRRMLGALGNINQIADTVIHAQIYKYLIELFDVLVKIRNNQGVTPDNLSTPPAPSFVPPFTIFAPWCFRALNLPDTYHRGRLYAMRLLCMLTCRPHDNPLPKTHLVQFYKVLHSGLTGQKVDMMNTLIKFTGPRFFSLMLPGYTAYILDYLYAANCIISTQELKGVPRTEATSIVGALLAFPAIVPEIPLLMPNPSEFSLVSSADVKDQIIGVLLKSGKKEPAGLARCISLSSLGIFVYSELIHESFHPKIKEAIQVLLTALRFNNKAVAQIASDMLMLLSDHVANFLTYYPEVPKKIVEVLARTLTSLMPRGVGETVNEDEKRLLLSIMACLGEWCMRIPHHILTQPQEDGRSLLFHVFGALQAGCEPPGTSTPSPVAPDSITRREGRNFDEGFPSAVTKNVYGERMSPAVMVDFDPNIHVDNTKEGYVSNNSSPLKKPLSGDRLDPPKMPMLQPECKSPVRLAARSILSHLVNHLFHFPMGVGAASLSSMVSEHDDIPSITAEELSAEVFQAPNIQFFVLNRTTLLSMVELPTLETPMIRTSDSQVRIILRDISGKFCWDSSALYGTPASADQTDTNLLFRPKRPEPVIKSPLKRVSAVSRGQTLRHRSAGVLPRYEDMAEDMDNLDDLLQYIGHSSPECLEAIGKPLNTVPASQFLEDDTEKDVITGVVNQRTFESDSVNRYGEDAAMSSLGVRPPRPAEAKAAFQLSRRLFNQLGFTSWERRPRIHLMKKNERLLRELKNLDNMRCRETHKIAVIYVAEGQEDKHSILTNSSGSQAYEDFVSGLAWEVELESHIGFMGGLRKNKSTGETSPYYATSFTEVMFHVATRMPSNSEESMLQKTRHLGNDEIHIVWTEHWRDYRRGILRTEFCDVLIIIYPLKNNLYRIQVSRKQDVPYFGPLFNEMIVDHKVLPGLVRATAINASRAKRSMLSHYQNHFEERSKALDSIIDNHTDLSTYEDFVTNVYSPAPLTNLFQSTRLPSGHQLASALLDSTQLTDNNVEMRLRSKTEVGHHHSAVQARASVSVMQHHHDTSLDDEASPKNAKKMSFKRGRPLSIKEEVHGIPDASPPAVPTRKR